MGEERVCRLCWELAPHPPSPLYCLGLSATYGEGRRPQEARAAPSPRRARTGTPRDAGPGSVLRYTQPGTLWGPHTGSRGPGESRGQGPGTQQQGSPRAGGDGAWGTEDAGWPLGASPWALGLRSQTTFESPGPIAAQMGRDEAAASRMSGQAGSVWRPPLRVGSSRGNCGFRYLRMPYPRAQRCPRCPTEG